jgi:hypothetical protein
MAILPILKIVAAVVTIATGLVSLIWPRSIMGFTGLQVPGARGITEIRAILGGAFIGLGAAPLILGAPHAYRMLGITYLVIGLARAAGMIVDRSLQRSNVLSLVVELVLGVLLNL